MEKLNISLKMVTGHFSSNLGETQGFFSSHNFWIVVCLIKIEVDGEL